MSLFDLTIAVLTFEGEALLPECLQSILRQGASCTQELLVVDNGSTTPVQLVHPGIRVHRLEHNVGNIAGMNECFRQARGEWVLFVANDVRLRGGCLDALWAQRRFSDVIQPVLLQPDGTVDNVGLRWIWPGYGRRERRIQHPWYTTPAFAATCFLAHRQTFLDMGGFDERLGLSHEDIDFSLRLHQVRSACRHAPYAFATHLMGQTIGRTMGSRLSPHYHTARLRVLRKHYHGLNYWTRWLAVEMLDGLSALRRP